MTKKTAGGHPTSQPSSGDFPFSLIQNKHIIDYNLHSIVIFVPWGSFKIVPTCCHGKLFLETDAADKNTENGQVRRRQAENKIETKRKFFGKRTKSLNVNFPAIKDVSIVDRVSRIVFPFTFMIFNLIYWTFYNFF